MKNNLFSSISIIIPTFNEEANIEPLVKRIHEALSNKKISYELIVVDDHSTDQTKNVVSNLAIFYPIILVDKKGKKGKSFSIFEGIRYAQYDAIGMIDADLQYPPEAFPGLLQALETSDVVVTNRKHYKDSIVRKLFSKTFRFVFGRALFGLKHDIQSGLKVFTREVFETVKFVPSSPWTFDLEFLHRAKQAGFQIQNFDIVFSKRKSGKSKVGFLGTTFEIGFNALRVRAKRIHPAHIPPKQNYSMLGAGIGYKKRKYITHTTIPHRLTALKTSTYAQKLIVALILFDIGIGFYISPLSTLQILVAILSTIYFIDVFFNLYLIGKSLGSSNEIISSEEELNALKNGTLPIYTILCPLYREAPVIPQFLDAIEKIAWPKNKLDVILLLEEDDKTTIEAASKMILPSYVRCLIVPHSMPKTKPKACNYGLAHAKGEYLVIYDAEDVPDPNQLKKAYCGFKKVRENVICLQAKLNYYNPHQNLLTRFFTAEYSLWFDITLPGLGSIDTTLPLGGTSNHFKTKSLREVEGWDPFNVTEDADLGVRLFKKGYKTAMIDSVTLEEANSKVGNWFRQRSRWIKGYMQTYLVHTRASGESIKGQKIHSLIFHLVIGGKLAFALINPFLWLATFSYFALYAYVGPSIEAVYPSPVFYMAITSLVFGNFLFLYYYMLGLAKKGQWNLIKFVFLIPIYWLMISISAFIALYQLIFKPHYWEKTTHGLHLSKAKKDITSEKVLPFRLSGAYLRGGFFVASIGIGNFFNFLYNAYLGRVLNLGDFALVSFFSGLLSIAGVIANPLGKTVNYKSGYLIGKQGEEAAFSFWRFARRKAIFLSTVLSILWLAASPFTASFFKLQNIYPAIIFLPVILFGFIYHVDSGFLSSRLRFGGLGLLTILEAGSRLGTAVLLVFIGLKYWTFSAIPISIVVVFFAAWLILARSISGKKEITGRDIKKFPAKFFAAALVTSLSTIAFLSFDVVLAKHYLSPDDAGRYGLISLIGKIIFFLGSFATPFIMPLVARNEGAKKDSDRILSLTLLGTLALSVGGFIAVGIFGHITTPILFGDKAVQLSSFLIPVGFSMVLLSLSRVFNEYYLAKRYYTFSVVTLLLICAQVFVLSIATHSLSSFVLVMVSIWSLHFALSLTLHVFAKYVKIFENNIADFFSLFARLTSPKRDKNNNLRILILNWRDTKHVWAGGAESYVHELAKRWVKEGNSVTLFCGNDSNCPRNEIVDGVNVVRRGGSYMVYIWAFLYYILRFRGKYDVIIDCENGIPFFAPLYSKKPVFLLIHHIHQEVFRQQLRFPLSAVARFLEGSLMPRVYKNNKVITVSASSKNDILKIGLGKKNDISIVYPGIESSLFKKEEKAAYPLFTYVGRLKPYKNVDVAIRAFEQVAVSYPQARFIVVGQGESLKFLQKLTGELNLENKVIFMGRTTDLEKAKLLARAWAALQPSMVEGWGITVIEANAAGTPVIASDVNGLRDSVVNGQTGILVGVGDEDAFAHAMIDFILDENYRKTLSDNAFEWSSNFSWDESSKKFFIIISDTLNYSRVRIGRIQGAINKVVSIFL